MRRRRVGDHLEPGRPAPVHGRAASSAGTPVGNLLIVALWELLGDTVAGLDWVGRLLGAHGRVLPMSSVPLELAAEVEGAIPEVPDEVSVVRGQVACATTPGRVRSMSLIPADPPACPEAVQAIADADWVVLGPGSWFTSVLPHLLVPDLARALLAHPGAAARRAEPGAAAGGDRGILPACAPGGAGQPCAGAGRRRRARRRQAAVEGT